MKTFLFERSQPARSKTITNNDAGISMPSVPAQKVVQEQKDGHEPPLQGQFIAQRNGPGEEEEPLQMQPFQLKKDTAQLAAKEEELPLQGKFIIQQKAPGEEEEPLQMKPFQLISEKEELPLQKKANNTGIPDNLKTGIENLSGYAMDDVKVHYNSAKPAQLEALAYAQGTDIHIGPGQEKHLPHEAWHVAQQKQGRVQPTLQMKGGVVINDDKGLEREADVMGAKALGIQSENDLACLSQNKANTGAVQLLKVDATSTGSVEHTGLLVNTGATRVAGNNVNMTYHHIIPRNKLSTFWTRVVAKRHVKHLALGLTTAVAKAYERGGATATAFQDNAGQQIEKKHVNKLIDNLSKQKRKEKAIKLSPKEQTRGELFERVFQWMPGNIHRGPTTRISITAQGADPERDDGGNQFEISARHLIPADKYEDLLAMNTHIDNYIANNKDEDLIKISPIVGSLASQTSVYAFNPAKWYYDHGVSAWRIDPS
jgi:hypothetical protein